MNVDIVGYKKAKREATVSFTSKGYKTIMRVSRRIVAVSYLPSHASALTLARNFVK